MKYLIVFFVLIISFPAIAQQDTEVYEIFSQMPQFPGGVDSLRHYLLYHLEYPEYAKNHHIEGRVDVRFTVNEDGHISDIEIVKGEIPDINAEAVRVVKTFPNYIPGIKDGHPARMSIVIPIIFQLDENEELRRK
jgi:TonB family protein